MTQNKETQTVRNMAKNLASGVVSDSIYTPNEKYSIASFLLAIIFIGACAGCLWAGFNWGAQEMHFMMQVNPLHTVSHIH